MPDHRATADVDVAVVGAGFAGLYMLHRLRGLGLSTTCLEAGGDVGGTWYWNRYPGARCDVKSMQYSFGFDEALQQAWRWSERFASHPEILRYAAHVADRLDLRRFLRFRTRVEQARWDEGARRWHVRTDTGEAAAARHVVMATGCLSAARPPDIAGLAEFRGATHHTGAWPHEGVDFTGLRVGVIGTGSSAIQAIPVIAGQARALTVFQRTPNFSIPSRNAPMDDAHEGEWKRAYAERRREAQRMRTGIRYHLNPKSALEADAAEREREFEARWSAGGTAFMAAFSDLLLDERANHHAAEFVRTKIRALVRDPAVAEALAPKDHPIGTKRICVDTRYHETFNLPHVRLVNLREAPIARVTEAGLETEAEAFALDALVFATGFDAMTGALDRIAIHGRGGETLREKWAAGPRTHLGLMSAGFPNLHLITGPGSPSVLSNMLVSIEQHVDWVGDLLAHMAQAGAATVEPTRDAEDAWVEEVQRVAARTLYPRAASWYMGANVPGKPRLFMPYVGGVGTYRELCDGVAAQGYPGFVFDAAEAVAEAAE